MIECNMGLSVPEIKEQTQQMPSHLTTLLHTTTKHTSVYSKSLMFYNARNFRNKR
jgi:hypothetical protein